MKKWTVNNKNHADGKIEDNCDGTFVQYTRVV